MRIVAPTAVMGGIALIATLGLAQTQVRPGFHPVTLPQSSTGAQSVQSTVLLETPHLKLVAIVVPKGGALPPHASPSQVSIQALAGAGELRMAGASERIDATHAIVLAPNMQHEVRASSEADLVLLVHHVLVARRGMGPGAGPGSGRGMGPRATPSASGGATPSP